MNKNLILFLFSIFCITFAVDRSNFKTCSQSGFCKRQREYNPGDENCKIVDESLKILKNAVESDIHCTKRGTNYLMRLSFHENQIFRLKITEKNPVRQRYELKMGDALQSEPKDGEMTINFDKENHAVLMKGSNNEKGILYLNPFKLDLYVKEMPVISVNSRNLFNYEVGKTESPEKTLDNSTEPSYTESFKEHVDSMPHGHTSVGMDISFPGFQYVYGIPEHADKFALRNTNGGDPYRLYNLDVFEYELNNPMALYGSVPLMWAHNVNVTVGMFWHNPTETWIDVQSSLESLSSFSKIINFVKGTEVKENVETHWMSESGVLDIFFLLADTPTQAFRSYGILTGTTPLPPQFSIAYHQCRWNYNDQKDVENVDKQFDDHDIPYDVIWLDIEHTEEKKYFTWDKIKFPNPNGMVDMLDKKNRKLVTVIDPHIKRVSGWPLHDEALSNEYFIKKSDGTAVFEGWCWPGASYWPDFMDERVRQWWGKQFLTYEASRAQNTFTWNDMGEPSVFNGPEVTMHKDALHIGGWESRDVHNAYGMQVHRATWDGLLLRSDNRERPFVLTRAFFAGSQRYGAIWTGDNTANWEHLKIVAPMLLSLSVSGIHFCGADVGGFFGNPDPELLTRWYQSGAWQPFFRAHAHLDTKRREPYLLPSPHKDIIRAAIQERYRMLPYWYTQFRHAEQTGEPVLAPLWQHFPRDTKTFSIDSSWMVGPSVLVHPVTDPGANMVDVYLPPGNWFMQSTWAPYTGGQSHSVPVTINSIPVFYRAGHIVPRRERVRRASYLSRYDPVTFLIFLDPELQTAKGSLYLDDLHSLDYKQSGKYIQLNLEFSEFVLVAKPVHVGFKDITPSLERIVICGLKEKPSKVIYTNEGKSRRVELEFFYMVERLLLVIRNPKVILGQNWAIHISYDKEEL